MSIQNYSDQVRLMLDVLPHIAKEECFALHGGTAINLFVRDMPRLSVDIDLTYLPLEERITTLKNITDALKRIKGRIEHLLPSTQVLDKSDKGKLVIRAAGQEIKIEVNLVGRGTIVEPERMMLCAKAQQKYDVSMVTRVVALGQLYGGKICAALDRQHPRDLFDVKILLENEGYSDSVRQGFLLCLLSSDRPIKEILDPNFQDQQQAMVNQFSGMSYLPFTYTDFEQTRLRLVQTVRDSLTPDDREFLLTFKNCEPDWNIHDFKHFPAVQWKLQNLCKLKDSNPRKYQELHDTLKELLAG